MDIKEYFERNLPNVNFNILPQLFEEEGIELTEEIVEYLKETPGNTNWSILEQLGKSGSDAESLPKIIEVERQNHNVVFTSNSDIKNFSEFKTMINKYATQPDPQRSNYWTISTEYMKLRGEDSQGISTDDNITWCWYSGGNIFEFNIQNETIRILVDE